MKIFFVSRYFFGCAWPIRVHGYAWIWLDRPRSEDMLGYSHLGLVCCLLAEGAGLWLAEGNLPFLGPFLLGGGSKREGGVLNEPRWGLWGAVPGALASKTWFCTSTSNRRFVCPGVVYKTQSITMLCYKWIYLHLLHQPGFRLEENLPDTAIAISNPRSVFIAPKIKVIKL